MTGFDMRLVAYEPGGPRIGLMPEPLSFTPSVPFNDVGALTITYSSLAVGGGILARGLEQGLEVAIEVTGTHGWTEPAGCRFLLITRRQDATDDTGTVRLTLPSYGWLMRKARNLDDQHLLPEDHSQAGKRPFYSASAGVILATLLQENQTRGGITLARSFTTGQDSGGIGSGWNKVVTLFFELGLDLWTILRSLTDQGMVDWTTTARTLDVYNADTILARDLTTGDQPVRLHLGRDVTEAPEDESLEDVVGRVLIRGDEGLVLTETNPSAPSPWGVWEGYLSQGGVSDEGTARSLAQADLARGGRVRGQYTRGILPATASHLPLVHYRPGDYIQAPGARGVMERLRVQQITLTKDADGITGNLILNDRIVEAELRRTRRITGITGGSTADGGSGARPAPEGPDRRQPSAPLGLVVSTNAYLDELGEPRGQVSAVYDEVTTATDGTALEVTEYELWGRPNVTGAPWRHLTSADDTRADYSPLPVGEEWAFRVRARGRYTAVWGAWSSTFVVTVASDTTPPPPASAPVLASALGVISVEWDGLTNIGTQMPVDFDRVEVVMSATTSSAAGTVVGELRREGTWVVVGQPAGATRYFWLRAVDTSDNEAALSLRRQVTVVSVRDADLVDTTLQQQISDVATGPVDGARVIPGTLRVDALTVGIGNRVVDPFFLLEELRVARTPWNVTWSTLTYQPGSAYSALVAEGGWGLGTGAQYEDLVPVEPGARIYFTVAARRNSGLESRFRFAYDARLADGTTTVRFVPGSVEYTTDTTSTWYEAAWEVPSDVVAIQMRLQVTAGTVRFERPYWQPQATAVTIADGAVTAPKIEANAVGAREANFNELWTDEAWIGWAQIAVLIANSIQTEHLASDAITAKHEIVGALIKTLQQQNRGIELRGNNIDAFDNFGNRRTRISGSTGEIDTTGRVLAGSPTGINAELTPTAYESRPGVRFNHGSNVGLQPVIYSVGSGVDDYPWRSLLIHGSEQTLNSSGRAELQLLHGGDFDLRQTHGTHNGTGIIKRGQDLSILGRLAAGQGERRQIISGGGGWEYISEGTDTLWNVQYGAPAYSGRRRPIVSAIASSEFGACIATGRNTDADGFQVSLHAIESGNYLYSYVSFWEEPR